MDTVGLEWVLSHDGPDLRVKIQENVVVCVCVSL